ncbi:hypothetical protein [Sandaracinus amylolyticus]|uniref:hypothetical protein n=1 Tax=Sandaracinus amylolyticus TaxID=927083 RepID=UPI001F360A60|nr:hypothetical protein [Sandaracinus amylolyticus]UJR85741.1 Hypothetical protein I5071_78210 [Sandaracinus amylolyticus]
MRQPLEPSIRTTVLAAFALLGVLGCASPRRATFEISFASASLAQRAVRVSVTVSDGSCRGSVLHQDAFDVREQGAPIAPLPPGTYGFRVQVSDASCAVYAEGCTQMVLPTDDAHVVVVVAERTSQSTCDPTSCRAGVCGGPIAPGDDAGEVVLDAGIESDAGARDGGVPPPPIDAGTDAGAPPGELIPSNIPPTLVSIGAAELVVRASDSVVLIDTDIGTIERLSDGSNRRPAGAVISWLPQLGGAPDLMIVSLGSLRIEAGAELRVVGSTALVLAVNGAARIEGRLDADADGADPGPGGFAGGTESSRAGRGPCGGGAGPSSTDVGGGGGGHAATGGEGGDHGSTRGGAAGARCGDDDLAPLSGGSGGAAGGGSDAPGEGGGGGGAVQIVADSIVIAAGGAIDCAGGGGRGGSLDDGAGGGGAGGAILLEARTLDVHGALVANGGGGGAGADLSRRGADGEPGQTAARVARGGTGSGEGASGGAGGASGALTGVAGADASGSLDNAGGGGGAGGRLRLRAATMSLDGAVISPREATTFAGL